MATTSKPHALDRLTAPAAALIIAAPLADALASVLHPPMPDDLGRLLPLVEQTPRWYPMSLVGLLASGLLAGASVVLGRIIRPASPILGTVAMITTFIGAVLMASMQGFKLFLPTLADLAPKDGATAVGEFTGGLTFLPMIGAFVLRALGIVLLGIAAARSRTVRWPIGVTIAAGAVLAFQLPAGPDALGWLIVAGGTACIVRAKASGRPAGQPGREVKSQAALT